MGHFVFNELTPLTRRTSYHVKYDSQTTVIGINAIEFSYVPLTGKDVAIN